VADRLDTARAALEAERKDLQQALERVEKALNTLGAPSAPRTRRATSSNGRRRSTRRSRNGNRGDQLKGVVKGTKGLKPSEIAREMGVSQSQVHGIVKRLSERGEVTKADGKVRLSS